MITVFVFFRKWSWKHCSSSHVLLPWLVVLLWYPGDHPVACLTIWTYLTETTEKQCSFLRYLSPFDHDVLWWILWGGTFILILLCLYLWYCSGIHQPSENPCKNLNTQHLETFRIPTVREKHLKINVITSAEDCCYHNQNFMHFIYFINFIEMFPINLFIF